MKNTRRSAFTLIEILIVVVIMAVLAATIIPQFSTSTDDAKSGALKFNLHTLREQVDLYKVNHNGAVPSTITAGGLPQMVGTTDATGATGTGTNYPFGPYMTGGMPNNPYDNKNTVSSTTATSATPPTAATAAGGWLYNTTTGDLFANTANHLTD